MRKYTFLKNVEKNLILNRLHDIICINKGMKMETKFNIHNLSCLPSIGAIQDNYIVEHM